MKTEEIEKLFHEVKAAFEAGAITERQFKAEAKELLFQDSEGRYWAIGIKTEQWYRYEEGDWVNASPPPTLESVAQEITPPEVEAEEAKAPTKRPLRSPVLLGLIGALFLVCLIAVAAISYQVGRLSVMALPAEDTPTTTSEATEAPEVEPTATLDLAGPEATPVQPEHSPTSQPTVTESEASPAPTPTHTRAPQRTPTPVSTPQMRYSPPVLLDPENGAERGPGYKAILTWQPVGELSHSEYYHVEVCWNGCSVFWGDYVQDTTYEFPWFKRGYAIDDRYYWHVTVRVQRGEAPAGPLDPPISPPSETWMFMYPD
ncbi:MAG: hypothetical protein GTO63_20105 [Anaerolineae bacterium]|nr:hypothetical protein [Anaerolineae bacterium]NIN97086.1 hypothetical protein [Anaerolineae bacterium]NIQ80034.1 hypothetical protein [Anaerolineae bacterium]